MSEIATSVGIDRPTFGSLLDILSQLEDQGKLQSESGIGLTIGELSFEEWLLLGRAFGAARTGIQFVIGDWIVYGEGQFGDKYAQAADLTGYAPQTLLNLAYTCRNVPRSRRRWPELRFSHHKEVAALPAAAQVEWLARAVDEGWSKERLREELRGAAMLPPAPEQPAWGAAARERAEELSKVTEEMVAAVRGAARPEKLREIAERAERVLVDRVPARTLEPAKLTCPSCGFEFDD